MSAGKITRRLGKWAGGSVLGAGPSAFALNVPTKMSQQHPASIIAAISVLLH